MPKLIVRRPHFNADGEVVLAKGTIVDSTDPRVDRNRCSVYNEAKVKKRLADKEAARKKDEAANKERKKLEAEEVAKTNKEAEAARERRLAELEERAYPKKKTPASAPAPAAPSTSTPSASN